MPVPPGRIDAASTRKVFFRARLVADGFQVRFSSFLLASQLKSVYSVVTMKWPEGRELDRAFGPRFPHEYDLTLQFEHIFLTILPSVVFILVALCYLRNYARQPTYTRAGGLKWVELVRFICDRYEQTFCLSIDF
jgi:hypothetical protein